MVTKVLNVPRISCEHCVATIERALGEMDEVQEVTADAKTKLVSVTYREPENLQAITDTLKDIGYPVKE